MHSAIFLANTVLRNIEKHAIDSVKQAYLACFGVAHVDQDKSWAPPKVCKTCVECLRQWTNRERKS